MHYEIGNVASDATKIVTCARNKKINENDTTCACLRTYQQIIIYIFQKKFLNTHTHTHIYTQTHIHTQRHTHTDTHTHRHTHTHIHTHTHTHTPEMAP